jgi:membrane associated rhomboid family serine protease
MVSRAAASRRQRGADGDGSERSPRVQVSPPTAEVCARVHQLVLLQGDERVWNRVPVLFDVPPAAAPGPRLPAGALLVLPWDFADPHSLEVWLARLIAERGAAPANIALITSVGHVNEAWLSAVGARFGVRVAAVEVATGAVVGDDALADALALVLDPDATAALDDVNPLEFMRGSVADPRDPRVFAERLRRAAPRVWVSNTILGVNVAVFALMQLVDGWPLFRGFSYATLDRFGANITRATRGDGEWWRLLSCTFLHGDVFHIAMNMWALRVLGETTERLFGRRAFAVVYFVSAIGGSLASLAFTLSANPDLPSVGASGAIFGLMGALLGYALSRRGSVPPELYRQLTRSAIFFILINGAIGFSVEFIDNGAHMGGLAFGTLAGLLLSRDLPPSPQPGPAKLAVAAAVLVAALAAMAAYAGML